MANSEVGSAFVTIYPDTSKFHPALAAGLSGMDGAGFAAGQGAVSGFQKALSIGKIAIGNMVAGLGMEVAGMFASSIGTGIARVDILENFPQTMVALGYSADKASESIEFMMEHLDGLPTATQDLAVFVQGLTASTGDLDKATKAGAGFNDMLLAAGADAQTAANAQEMFNKMIGSGEYNAQRWQTIMSSMPGQMKQLSEYMLGAGKDGWDLADAIKNGTVSYNDMLDAIIELDEKGGEGFASFEEQARAATGGIDTAIQNFGNRLGAFWQKIIQAIGSEEIAGVINTISYAIKDFGGVIASAIDKIQDNVDFSAAIEGISGLASGFGELLSAGVDKAADLFIEFSNYLSQVDFSYIASAVDWLGKSLSDAGERLGKAFDIVKPYLGGIFEGAVRLIANAFMILAGAIDVVSGMLEPLAQFLADTLLPVIESVVNGINTVLENLDVFLDPTAGQYDLYEQQLEQMRKKSDQTADSIAKDSADAANATKSNYSSAASSANSSLNSIGSTASSSFSGTVSAAKSAASSIASAFNNAHSTVPKPKLPVISVVKESVAGAIVPHFNFNGWKAEGGLFNRPTFIGIGEAGAEGAIPLEGRRMRPFARAIAAEMGGGDSGSNYVVNLNYDAGADANQMARDLARRIKRYQLAKGV